MTIRRPKITWIARGIPLMRTAPREGCRSDFRVQPAAARLERKSYNPDLPSPALLRSFFWALQRDRVCRASSCGWHYASNNELALQVRWVIGWTNRGGIN